MFVARRTLNFGPLREGRSRSVNGSATTARAEVGGVNIHAAVTVDTPLADQSQLLVSGSDSTSGQNQTS